MPRKKGSSTAGKGGSELSFRVIEQPQPLFPGRHARAYLQSVVEVGNVRVNVLLMQIKATSTEGQLRHQIPALRQYAEFVGIRGFEDAPPPNPHPQPLLRYQGRDYLLVFVPIEYVDPVPAAGVESGEKL